MAKPLDIHTGGCLCGNIKYEASGAPVVVAHCHCNDCQRSSGAGHTTGAMFAVKNVTISGETSNFTHQSNVGTKVTKTFCPKCGSSVFGQNDGSHDYITISLGSFDDSSAFNPEVVIFAQNKKPWDVMDDTLLTFEEQPDWKPKK